MAVTAPVSFDSLRHDLRDTWRTLLHARRFTGWIAGSLAVGMAVTIAALALLNATMVLPFPGVTAQDRLARIAVSRNCGRPDCWVPRTGIDEFETLRAGLTGLDDLAAYAQGEIAIAVPAAQSVEGVASSANYFDVLGVGLAAGRGFSEADAASRAAVAVVSHRLWTRDFGGSAAAVGRTIRVGDRFVEIVGVAPPGFAGIDRVRPGRRAPDVWFPLWLADAVLPPGSDEAGGAGRTMSLVGRLRDGLEIPHIQAQADVVASRLAAAWGEAQGHARAEVRGVWRVRPETWHFGAAIVLPIPLLVLAIACVNAGNLMLARGSQRTREIAVRVAIGAGRGRIVRQLLFESAALALVATAAALPMAWWGLQVAARQLETPIPIDGLVLALTVLAGAATTLAFGLVPALRISSRRPSTALGSTATRGDASRRESRMRSVLVVAQATLSLGLLATAWQLVGTVRAQAVSGGTPPDRLLIARFNLQPLNMSPDQMAQFYEELRAGTQRLPGVEAVGLARHTSVWTFGRGTAAGSLVVWKAGDRAEEGRVTAGGYAGGALFDALGLHVLEGRSFTDQDRTARPLVALVNTTLAQQMGSPAVGSTLRIAPRRQDAARAIEVRVIGIIEATLEPRLEPGGPPPAKLYVPSPLEAEPALAVYVRTYGPAAGLAQPVRELVGRIAPRVPVTEIGSLAELNERSYALQLWLARAGAALGAIGMLLAAAGLYGISSFVVGLRSREFAIRMALGARSGQILRMVLRHWMRLAVAGLVIGSGAALAASRIIQSEYHGIQDLDTMAFIAAAAAFLIVMLAASAAPAIRASRVDPIADLKEG